MAEVYILLSAILVMLWYQYRSEMTPVFCMCRQAYESSDAERG